MSALTPILPKVAPLIGKLASDRDPEVLAAVRQLRRVLADSGLSFNDLAPAIEPQPKRPVNVDASSVWEPSEWRELAQWIVNHDCGQLRPHERRFAADMVRRLVLHGEPTPKQAAWLRALYTRLGGGA